MTRSTPVQSYVGLDVYAGIDVHQRTYTVWAQVEQEKVKKWTMTASPSQLGEHLTKYFAGGCIHSVYEAGFSGYGLHRELKDQGIDSIVVHPASVEVATHNRVKTDKRDAQKLAIQLEAGRLKGIRTPSPEQEQRRLLSRTRSQLVSNRAWSRVMAPLKSNLSMPYSVKS